MKTFLLELQYALLITASTTVGSSRGLANNNIVPPSPSTPTTTTTTMIETTTAKNILYDIPISNNGARARIILYKKEIPPSECTILSPVDIFGGLKSDDYLKINPQGKVPSLICPTNNGLSIAESDTICRYLLHTYAHIGPSFQPDNPLSNMIARFHDMYLTTIQSCLYRASPPFGPYHCRKSALQEYSKQLYIIEKVLINAIDSKSSSPCSSSSSSSSSGPYLCGEQISLADATLFPSIVFATYMFPKFSGGGGGATPPGILFDDDDDSSSSSTRPPIPRKIQDWFQTMIDTDTAFNSVYKEMMEALSKWDANGRWDTIWLAGRRDTEPSTIFDEIVSGDIPSTIVKQDDKILAFKDINPAAPAHVLVIPKDRQGLTRLRMATPEHYEILGRLMVAAGEIAKDETLGFGEGARIVVNDGTIAGQEVFHLHVHVMGGRDFTWPPG